MILLLFQNRHNNTSFSYLSLVLFFFLLSLLSFGILNILANSNYASWIPYLHLELIYGFGPSLYMYALSLTDNAFKFKRVYGLHFILPILECVYYRTPLFRNGAIGLSERADSLQNTVFQVIQWGGIISILIYLGITAITLMNYRKWLGDNHSNFESKKLTWLEKPVLIYTVFWAIWIPTRIMDIFVLNETARPYYFNLGFLILAALTCWIGFKGYLTAQTNTVGFLNTKKQDPQQKFNLSELKDLAEILQQKMFDEKYYLDSELTLSTFAKHVGSPQKLISKTLNHCLNLSFHEFVNAHRVEAFKRNVQLEEYRHLSLLGVALESGFGSKSTFNLVFKSNTGLTPKKFRDQLVKNKS
ncbi:MAG: helix-turn-helix domain-containing protein [Croceivirga sp.]